MSAPTRVVRLQRADYALVIAWTLLFLLGYAGMMTAYVLVDPSIPWVLPWKLAGISVLLVFAAQRGHYPLVLGLCGAVYLLQDFPLYGSCFLIVTLACYGALHYGGRYAAHLFWAGLVLFAVVLPKALFYLFPDQPGRWNWLVDMATTGLVLRYAYYFYEWRRGLWEKPDYFRHLGYIAFIPQIYANLNYSPSQQWEGAGNYPVVFRRGLQLLGLAFLKIIAWRLLNHFAPFSNLNPADPNLSPAAAWGYVLLNYVKWFLWLSAKFDLCVVFCRFLGADIPPNFRFPLLATSPIEHWRRWNIFNRKLLLKFFFFPLGGSQHHTYRNVVVVFAASALILHTGWFGSKYLLADPGFLLHWLAYALCQAGLVIANMEWRRRRGLGSHHRPSGWAAFIGWAATFSAMAWLHVLILGHVHNTFTGDRLLDAGGRLRLVLRGLGLDA
ncbi:MAG: hypothetical protein SFU85_03825 [Candidatus Methylacidiphilales bacterium]|nr:hypothetical protein [Candidatus Methylacidiphilales bacterium]